ncbi:serine hydrolase domain-containing protein [Paenibacillus sp. MMS20-IR301]|uniref:serine hydrolase domain-containing protein n=1 Tax=Paenibacillus sp. MMS20-IR301 TaxID=2895946 RepID=UPI0028EBC990|nr:serine hydrolase domain-containing protein [Paenibacillus sp. MMS20-IR301]WNS45972.1 serine hydrolase domain-containing protein [Paenibacillus sp. MMS20-IR301]
MQAIRAKLEDYITTYLRLWDFYGVIQVIRKGEIWFEQAGGYANLEFGIHNTMDSRFSLASMSKQFTAFAVMLLYDKQMLDIDKPACLYLPAELKIDESVTVHHLLSHTSGLYNFYNFEDDFFAGYNRLEYSRTDFFRQYINKKPVQPAGSGFDYNNSNYNLLAWIIEHVSGETYEDFIRSQLFLPLNMLSSAVDNGCTVIAGQSGKYVKDYGTTIRCPYHNEKFSIGAGAVVSSCGDLYKWYTCLRERKLLSPEVYTRFFSENLNGYCYGLEYSRVHGQDRYAHGGDHLGTSTYMQNFFAEDICIIILSNNEGINQYRLGNAIADILHQAEVEEPVRHAETDLSESGLAEYCGTYLKDKIQLELINGKLYFTRFCGNLHIELYPAGEGRFARRYYDQFQPYTITENEQGGKNFFGYTRNTP